MRMLKSFFNLYQSIELVEDRNKMAVDYFFLSFIVMHASQNEPRPPSLSPDHLGPRNKAKTQVEYRHQQDQRFVPTN
jgi:hypothetical protein